MTIQVKFFASLKDAVGKGNIELDNTDLRTVEDVWRAATESFPKPNNLLAAVNHQHVDLQHPVADKDEVAFFPPVTGG